MYSLLYWTILFKIACGFKRVKKNFFSWLKNSLACLKEKRIQAIKPETLIDDDTKSDEELEESITWLREHLSQTERKWL